jgi:lipoyl(octanoyl) transferase
MSDPRMGSLRCTSFPLPLAFPAAYDLQMRCVQELARSPERLARLILLEHAPVYTLGRTTKPEHLPVSREELARLSGAEVVATDRGGSVTYHGPGQLTAYLILNLKAWGLSVHEHLWNLEEIAVGTLAAFGLRGQRVAGMTGVWTESAECGVRTDRAECGVRSAECKEGPAARTPNSEPRTPNFPLAKVCAIGVGCRRWVTYHGLALNVDLDLAPFARIDPCGLGHRPVTSLSLALGRPVARAEAEQAVVAACAKVLKVDANDVSCSEGR